MIELSQIAASNQRIATTFPRGLTAVFVGGTSGIGEYTLKALSKYAPSSKFYIVGRSQEAADRVIRECSSQSKDCSFEFIQADINVLKNVDEVCRKIMSKEKSINLLFLTPGSMAFETTTPDNLPLPTALGMHVRIRLIQNLLPIIHHTPGLRRIVSVGAGTCEGPIDLTNIPAVGFPLFKFRDQLASVMTISLENFAKQAPSVSFVHTVPGVVESGITRDAQGVALEALRAIEGMDDAVIGKVSPGESGERHAFCATSGLYPCGDGRDDSVAVEMDEELPAAKASFGRTGTGVYLLGKENEDAPDEAFAILDKLRSDGTADKVWEYLMNSFKDILGSAELVH